jgi:hypothetical protein
MRPSKRVQEVTIFVATLLLLCGLSAAQKPNTIDWGKSVDGLQMSIYHEQAEDRQSEFSKFRVEFRNAGHNDLLLNLGIMSRNGGQQYSDAVSLILEDAQGKPQRLELKKSFQPNDAVTTLFLPLPVGGTFSFPVDLRDYRAVTSKEFDFRLKPGTYWLAAQFTGFRDRVIVTAQGPVQAGPPILAVRTFDTVNPENALGAPPISNTLRFEVPNR